jgi:uncharacterized membrane protein YphA (DoxX/SURF4 family)
MRLPGTILQGILARSALTFLRIYLGGAYVLLAWSQVRSAYSGEMGQAPLQWGELLVGVALVLGLLTRLAAAGALVLAIYPFLSHPPELLDALRAEPAWACIALALMVGAAGRTLGLDSLLAKRWMRSPFW